MPYAPKVTARLALDYTIAPGDGRGEPVPRIGVSHQGNTWFDERNTIGQDCYTPLDAGLAWKLENGTVLNLYATTLTDGPMPFTALAPPPVASGQADQLGRCCEVGIRFTKSF